MFKKVCMVNIFALGDVGVNIPTGSYHWFWWDPNGSGKTIIRISEWALAASGNVYIRIVKYLLQKTKQVVSYLPDTTYLDENKISRNPSFLQDFYKDFNVQRAYQLLNDLQLHPGQKIWNNSLKGIKKKFINFGHESLERICTFLMNQLVEWTLLRRHHRTIIQNDS